MRVQRKGGRRRGATEGLAEGGRWRWFAGAAGREEERAGAVAPLLVELLDDGAAGAWARGRAGRSWWVLEREEGSMEKGGCVREREIEGDGDPDACEGDGGGTGDREVEGFGRG